MEPIRTKDRRHSTRTRSRFQSFSFMAVSTRVCASSSQNSWRHAWPLPAPSANSSPGTIWITSSMIRVRARKCCARAMNSCDSLWASDEGTVWCRHHAVPSIGWRRRLCDAGSEESSLLGARHGGKGIAVSGQVQSARRGLSVLLEQGDHLLESRLPVLPGDLCKLRIVFQQVDVGLPKRSSGHRRHVLDHLIERNAQIVRKEFQEHDARSVSVGGGIVFRVDVHKVRVSVLPPLLDYRSVESRNQADFRGKLERHDPADCLTVSFPRI